MASLVLKPSPLSWTLDQLNNLENRLKETIASIRVISKDVIERNKSFYYSVLPYATENLNSFQTYRDLFLDPNLDSDLADALRDSFHYIKSNDEYLRSSLSRGEWI